MSAATDLSRRPREEAAGRGGPSPDGPRVSPERMEAVERSFGCGRVFPPTTSTPSRSCAQRAKWARHERAS